MWKDLLNNGANALVMANALRCTGKIAQFGDNHIRIRLKDFNLMNVYYMPR